jgi:tripartite ATP-independent transporter DctM subunit
MIPGLTLSLLYIIWVVFKSIVDPQSCPPLLMTAEEKRGLPGRILGALLPPLMLILAVLGSILTGIATPTESAAVGAVGAMILAAMNRQLNIRMLKEVMDSTLRISSMVFVILMGASVFSLVFRGLGGEHLVEDILKSMPGGQVGAIFLVMFVMFILGFFLDTFEIIFIMVPITAPVLLKLGVDPIWLGVIMGVNLQTSFLTPPFGFALFYLRGVAGKLVSTADIYRGIIPFVGLQVVGIALVWAIPEMATWIPDQLFSVEALNTGGERQNIDDALKGLTDMGDEEEGGGLNNMFQPRTNN